MVFQNYQAVIIYKTSELNDEKLLDSVAIFLYDHPSANSTHLPIYQTHTQSYNYLTILLLKHPKTLTPKFVLLKERVLLGLADTQQ